MSNFRSNDIDPGGDSVEEDGTGASLALALPTLTGTGEIPKRCLVAIEGTGHSFFTLTPLAGTATTATGCAISRNNSPYIVKTLARGFINHFTEVGSTIHVTPLND